MALFSIKNLSFAYPGAKYRALDNVNLEIKKGSLTLLCGRSGCGKTTLLKHLKNELTPYGTVDGEILFEDKPLKNLTLMESAQKIGFVMQNADNQIVTDKVYSELAFGLESLGLDGGAIKRRIAEMASFFGIHRWFRFDTHKLSGGQKQMLNLASVMVMQPEALLLDEPTAQLDPIAAGEFLNAVIRINNNFGTTVIITEHRLDEIFHATDNVIIMNGGAVIDAGTPRETAARAVISQNAQSAARAFPAAVRLYGGLGTGGECPVTVKEGAAYLKKHINRPPSVSKKNIAEPVASVKKNGGSAVKITEAFFRYERDSEDVLSDLSASFSFGEITCVLGGNGSGKTTLLGCIGGINKLYRGRIEISGRKIESYKNGSLYDGVISSLPQNPEMLFVNNTVIKELEDVAGNAEDIEMVIQETGVAGLLDSHPFDLSGGEQQKAALAKILLTKPKIILLDEPTKGLDAFYKQGLSALLKKLTANGVAVIISTHDVEFAATAADKCMLLFDGAVLSAGSPVDFFGGNYFYTSAANRIARSAGFDSVTVETLIEACLAAGVKAN